ncbi:MAG: hypothetical protein ACK5TP_03385 [bacterium]
MKNNPPQHLWIASTTPHGTGRWTGYARTHIFARPQGPNSVTPHAVTDSSTPGSGPTD